MTRRLDAATRDALDHYGQVLTSLVRACQVLEKFPADLMRAAAAFVLDSGGSYVKGHGFLPVDETATASQVALFDLVDEFAGRYRALRDASLEEGAG